MMFANHCFSCSMSMSESNKVKDLIFKQLYQDSVNLNMFCTSRDNCSEETLGAISNLWDEFTEKSFIKISGNWEETPTLFNSNCKYGLDIGLTFKEKITDPSDPLVIKNIATVGINYTNNLMTLDMKVWKYINSYQCAINNNQDCSIFLYANEYFKRYSLLASRRYNLDFRGFIFKINGYDRDPSLQSRYMNYFENNLTRNKLTFRKNELKF